MIPRQIETAIARQIQAGGKAVIIFGARQVGKTTLVRGLVETLPQRVLWISADELRYVDVLSSRDLPRLRGLVAGYDLLVIDEAQRVPEIGMGLKLLIDNLPALRVVVTGSSSLELASRTREPLTGRAWRHVLHPIATCELARLHNPFELQALLPERLVFGSYPEIFSIPGHADKRAYLTQLTDSYIFKDVLELSSIRHAAKLRKLLQLLAFQIGNEVSLAELAGQLELSRDTVASYIDLLEESFVLFRLSGYSRNLRKEVSKKDKIYFWDIGVRNALIGHLQPLGQRADQGPLWENFIIAERRKWLAYSASSANTYFWRTHTGAEIDWIEESEGALGGFEFKWREGPVRPPKGFLDAYPGARFAVITPANHLPFVGVAEP